MRSIGRASIQCIIEIIIALPILLAISAYWLPYVQMPLWIAMLWVCGLLGFVLSPIVSRLHVTISIALQCLLSFSFFIFVFDSSLAGWAGGFIGCFAFVRGVLYSQVDWHEITTTTNLWFGVLFYFLASFFFMFMDRHEPLLPVVYIFGSVNLLAAFIAGNVLHLRSEAGFSKGSNRVNPEVKKHNFIFLALFLMLVFVLWITGVIRTIFIGLRDLLIGWLTDSTNERELENTTPPPTGEEPPFIPEIEPSETSWLDVLFSIFAYLLGGAITLFLIFLLLRYVLYYLYKAVIWVLKYWSQRGSGQTPDELGYVDEKKYVLERNVLMPKWRLWPRRFKVRWEDLNNNRERIRFLYSNAVLGAIKHGFSFRKSDTPSETIRQIRQQHLISDSSVSQLLENEYNRARYGQSFPSDQAIERIKESLDDH